MSDSRIWGSGQSRSMHLSPDGVLRRCVSPDNCRYKTESLAFASKRDKQAEQRTLNVAAGLFHKNLIDLVCDHPRCAAARDLDRRRIPVTDPCLGWIPSRRAALKQLETAGLSKTDLLEAGLADTRRGGTGLQFYAHDRLTLSVLDADGNVDVFYARSYAKPKGRPATVSGTAASMTSGLKYVASRPMASAVPERDPESNLYLGEYVKPLFLADRAVGAAREKRELYVVEGQFDALACWYGGVENTVSIAGCTDFYQSNLDACLDLMDGSGKIIICMDNDEAGVAGMRRIARRFPNADIDVLEPFSDGKDPCDYRAEHGDKALRTAMSRHKPIMEALVESIPVSDVPAELAAVEDQERRRRLAEIAATAHQGDGAAVERLLAKAAKTEPRKVNVDGSRYRERRRWVRALGLTVQHHDKGKSFSERVASSEPMQLMARLAAAADAEGVELPHVIIARLPKQLREPGAVSSLGLDEYRQPDDDVESLLSTAKAKIWRDLLDK